MPGGQGGEAVGSPRKGEAFSQGKTSLPCAESLFGENDEKIYSVYSEPITNLPFPIMQNKHPEHGHC